MRHQHGIRIFAVQAKLREVELKRREGAGNPARCGSTSKVFRTQLSRVVEREEKGEEVIIEGGSMPVARLTKLRPTRPARRFGAMRGRARVTRAFFDSSPERELKRWE
jgi:antitoxin (DNA-binding transcriptional repressor) of toxin-antitoxin stability system